MREVLNCGAQKGQLRVTKSCRRRWDELAETGEPRERFCSDCDQIVHRVVNVVDARLRARQGECVAVPREIAAATRMRLQPDDDRRLIVGGIGSHWTDAIQDAD